MIPDVLSHVAPLLRAFLWLSVLGLCVVIGQALMEQLRNHL